MSLPSYRRPTSTTIPPVLGIVAFNAFIRILNQSASREIVSIPIDLADDPELAKLEEKGVKGRYTSIERLQEVEGGKVSWSMATSSTPGGSIPTFVAESSIDGQIANVGPPSIQFLVWLTLSA